MTINVSKDYQVPAFYSWDTIDHIQLTPLVIPDYIGPWGIRYIWIKHKERNIEFVNNYFIEGSNIGLNVRKQTTHLQNLWGSHNKIFEDSKLNGNLVWRVKVFNVFAQSIDYVEVWKSPEILTNTWGLNGSDNGIRSKEESISLSNGLFNSGFEIRSWRDSPNNWATVSKNTAIHWYLHFVKKWKARDNCIINTPWNKDLNPLNE